MSYVMLRICGFSVLSSFSYSPHTAATRSGKSVMWVRLRSRRQGIGTHRRAHGAVPRSLGTCASCLAGCTEQGRSCARFPFPAAFRASAGSRVVGGGYHTRRRTVRDAGREYINAPEVANTGHTGAIYHTSSTSYGTTPRPHTARTRGPRGCAAWPPPWGRPRGRPSAPGSARGWQE